MTTELEQLAKMVGRIALEPIDTAEMLEDSLRLSLGGASPDKIREMEDEIRNSGDTVENPNLKKTINVKGIKNNDIVTNASMEKVLISLYDTKDGLIQAFETCNINSRTASVLANQINKIVSCIRYMGGETDEFVPINHISGLSVPNFYKNAQKVIETTVQCYSLGEVSEAKVMEEGKKIVISFTGTSDNTEYKASGEIISDEWTGNEAIDYIYTPGSGQMSVKAFENGRWIDRRSSGKYKIVWQLEETDTSEEDKEGNKQENIPVMPNINPVNDSEEDIGNPLH